MKHRGEKSNLLNWRWVWGHYGAFLNSHKKVQTSHYNIEIINPKSGTRSFLSSKPEQLEYTRVPSFFSVLAASRCFSMMISVCYSLANGYTSQLETVRRQKLHHWKVNNWAVTSEARILLVFCFQRTEIGAHALRFNRFHTTNGERKYFSRKVHYFTWKQLHYRFLHYLIQAQHHSLILTSLYKGFKIRKLGRAKSVLEIRYVCNTSCVFQRPLLKLRSAPLISSFQAKLYSIHFERVIVMRVYADTSLSIN